MPDTDTYVFTDTDDCEFVDWDYDSDRYVWASWVFAVVFSFAFVVAAEEVVNVAPSEEQLKVADSVEVLKVSAVEN